MGCLIHRYAWLHPFIWFLLRSESEPPILGICSWVWYLDPCTWSGTIRLSRFLCSSSGIILAVAVRDHYRDSSTYPYRDQSRRTPEPAGSIARCPSGEGMRSVLSFLSVIYYYIVNLDIPSREAANKRYRGTRGG